jgi:hypothetical protein
MPENPFNPYFQQDIDNRKRRLNERIRKTQWEETARLKTKAAKMFYTKLVVDRLCSLVEAFYPELHVVKTSGVFERPAEPPNSRISGQVFDWAIISPEYMHYRWLKDRYFTKSDLKKAEINYRYMETRFMKARDHVVVGVNLAFDEQMNPSNFMCYRSNREMAAQLTKEGLVDALIHLHSTTKRTKLVRRYDGMISRGLLELWIRVGVGRRGRIVRPAIDDVYCEVYSRNQERLGTWTLEFAKAGGVGICEYQTFAEVDIRLDEDQNPKGFVIEPSGEVTAMGYKDLVEGLVKLTGMSQAEENGRAD